MDDKPAPHAHGSDDWEITHDITDWGSVVATVRMVNGPFRGEAYRLRTTKGMPTPAAARIEQHRYHLDLIERNGHAVRGNEWYGTFDTDDLGEALRQLQSELDLWAADEADHWELDGKLSHLRTLLGDALDYDQRRTHRSLRLRWPEIQDAYAALEMGFFPKPEGPPIPAPSRWVWQAPLLVLDRQTADGRLLSSQGLYPLHGGGAVVGGDPRTDGQRTVGWIVHLERHGHLVWAFGVSPDQVAAADLTAGRQFLSATLTPDPEGGQDLSGPLQIWHGGLVLGAHLRAPDQNPWGGWQA